VASGVYLNDFSVSFPPAVAALTAGCPGLGSTTAVRVCSPPFTKTSTDE
jgi:hypothetical protein